MQSFLKYTILLFFCSLFFIHHIFGYIGHYGFDDMHYAQISSDVLKGNIDFTDHFTFRWPLVGLTSVLYFLMGVNDTSSALPSLLVSCFLLFIVFWLVKKHKPIIITAALGLTASCPWLLFYSDKIMPDIYVALAVIFCLYIIHHHKYKSQGSSPMKYAMLLSFGLLFGFTSKGTMMLFLPLLGYLFLVDIILNRNRKFWFYSLLASVSIATIYFVSIGVLSGNPMARFSAISQNSYVSPCSYDLQSTATLFKRISYGLINMFTVNGLITGIIIAFPAFVSNPKKTMHFDEPSYFFTLSAFLLLASCNFMTISITSYSPMCLDPRHYLFIVPIASIAASFVIGDNFNKKRHWPTTFVFGAFLISSFFIAKKNFELIYLPTFIAILAIGFAPKAIRSQYLFITLFTIAQLLHIFEKINYANTINYAKQRSIIKEQILEKYNNAIILTNDAQARIGNYYTGFGLTNKSRFTNLMDSTPSTQHHPLLLLNSKYSEQLSGIDRADFPHYAHFANSRYPLLFEDADLGIKIFSIPKIENPYLIIGSKNSFETPVANWVQNPKYLSIENPHSGKQCIAISEYSSTFVIPMDSLDLDSAKFLLVKAHLYFNSENVPNASLCASIGNKETTRYWEKVNINKFFTVDNLWTEAKMIGLHKLENNNSETELKVFVWNNPKQKIKIDDFSVDVYKLYQ